MSTKGFSRLTDGGAMALLGDPTAWALVNIGGTEYKLPVY